MASRTRRSQPDNLDPLVDTLSNVVGILVIVIALTQIELGDALDRVAQLDVVRAANEARVVDALPAREAAANARRHALSTKMDADLPQSIALAEEILAELATIPLQEETLVSRDGTSLETEFAQARSEHDEAGRILSARSEHADSLASVPARLVARLPDPQILRGTMSWILVRHGRVFLVDRERLYEEGSRAFQRVIGPAIARGVRFDEYESAALYLRKRSAGTNGFRWLLQTEPEVRVELGWPAAERGIEVSRLARDPEWRAWLAARSPDKDFIRFQVWSDSFRTYLAARQAVEAAGFRAGWRGLDSDREIELEISFGPAPPRERAVEVD